MSMTGVVLAALLVGDSEATEVARWSAGAEAHKTDNDRLTLSIFVAVGSTPSERTGMGRIGRPHGGGKAAA